MAASGFMKMATARRAREDAPPGTGGVARIDRRVSRLLGRLRPGDVAIVDINDLDRSTADALIAAQVTAVVNVRPSISGRYPNLGPEVLISHGVLLIDDVGSEVFNTLKEGTRVKLDGAVLLAGDRKVAEGTRQDADSVAAAMAAAKLGMSAHLEAFASNTQQHMQRERALLLDGVGLPRLTTRFANRHVLLVARGYDFKSDIKALKHYIHEFRPVLVGVDAGADVLREAGYRPDLVVGDMDQMSDAVLREAGEVVAHADQRGRVSGLARVQDLRLDPTIFPSSGTSEDAAMLIADAGKAKLIVTVGIRATLEEFLDAGRGDMASTVLTRLKIGGRLVDAKSTALLYQTRVSVLSLIGMCAAALLAIAIVLAASSAGDSYLHILSDGWDHLFAWLRDLFS
jgi:uncharacterized membrane-anchored protein